jgi:hypothetical protein
MHATLTIDDKIAHRLKQEAALGKRSIKAIVNEALRRGLRSIWLRIRDTPRG